jgi:energy-coupling factor transporter ATP-binding protein EcfA2
MEQQNTGNDHSLLLKPAGYPTKIRSEHTTDWWGQLEYFDSQWKLVACNGDKQPIDPHTGRLLNEWGSKCIPKSEFKLLSRKHIQAVGLGLGPVSGGILAVDFDGEGAEEKFVLGFGKQARELPKSVSWTSGKPGRRQVGLKVAEKYWDKLRGRKTWKNDKGKTCLELRWSGHQSVILGAHPETSGYQWVPGCSPREVAVADAPEWLLIPLLSSVTKRPCTTTRVSKVACSSALELLNGIKTRDDYDGWLNVGMALHSEDESLLDAWIDWSRGSNFFDEQECIDKWATFNGGGITIGTLYYMFQQDNGFNPSITDSKRTTNTETTSGESSTATWNQLISALLQAVKDDDQDRGMELRAEVMSRFRRSDQQVDAALFELHTRNIVGAKPINKGRSLDLSKVVAMDWLIDGFIVKNDLTLVYGNAGSGKTTVALGMAQALLNGTGFLNRQIPCEKGRVLIIASDSGATPLKSTMQDMNMIDLPEVQEGPGKRLHVWASDSQQGMNSWTISLANCISLLEFVRDNQIDLVINDSCKAVCSGAGIDYADNKVVTAILTHFKEVICPLTSVVFINHDGTTKDANAGAKAWKEIPSVVHQIKRPDKEKNDGTKPFREWSCMKNRLGAEWHIQYKYEDGVLQPVQATEIIGTCIEEIIQILQVADHYTLSLNAIVRQLGGNFANGTIKNTLTTAVKKKGARIERIPGGEGYYRLKASIVCEL